MKWTKERIQAVANRFTKRSEFKRKYVGAYDAARNLGIFKEITKHMPKGPPGPPPIYTHEQVFSLALKYTHRTIFRRNHKGAFMYAQRSGILDTICAHMPKRLPRWTYESCLQDALKHGCCLKDWNGSAGQRQAYRKGWIKRIMKDAFHSIKVGPRYHRRLSSL